MIENIEKLNEIIKKCGNCKISKVRKNSNTGKGNINAKIMIIGEMPTNEEENKNELLVGANANILKLALKINNIDIEKDIYYTSLIKCKTYGNRKAEDDEVAMCINYLRNEVMLIRPKVIILLGKNVAINILGKNIDLEEKVVIRKNIKYIITYELIELFRDENKKIRFLEDIKLINEDIKQKGKEID